MYCIRPISCSPDFNYTQQPITAHPRFAYSITPTREKVGMEKIGFQCIQMANALPTTFSSGTKPQKRLSLLLSRLSPITKYCPSGTTHSPCPSVGGATSVLTVRCGVPPKVS